jgi:hypothetical protein
MNTYDTTDEDRDERARLAALPRTELRFAVTITVAGDPESFCRIFAQYLTEYDNPFLGDYAVTSYLLAGWPGPYVEAIEVANTTPDHRPWPQSTKWTAPQ